MKYRNVEADLRVSREQVERSHFITIFRFKLFVIFIEQLSPVTFVPADTSMSSPPKTTLQLGIPQGSAHGHAP